ncbi:MAG: hypothetical protein AAF633_10335, partial [Chloroflexota bacterium]
HQVIRNKRYYKRFNFESVPMEDYEIRDVLNRDSHPRVESRVGHVICQESEDGRIWSIPIFAKNDSLTVAKDTAITVEFLEQDISFDIDADRFQIKTQPKPSRHNMYIATFPEAIHRGLNKYFGTFRVKIDGPRALTMRIQVFSNGMRAKWFKVQLNLGASGATIKVLEEDFLY